MRSPVRVLMSVCIVTTVAPVASSTSRTSAEPEPSISRERICLMSSTPPGSVPSFCSAGLSTPLRRISTMSATMKVRASFGPRPRNSRSNCVKAVVIAASVRPLVLSPSVMESGTRR